MGSRKSTMRLFGNSDVKPTGPEVSSTAARCMSKAKNSTKTESVIWIVQFLENNHNYRMCKNSWLRHRRTRVDLTESWTISSSRRTFCDQTKQARISKTSRC